MTKAGFTRDKSQVVFRSPAAISVQFVLAGEQPGNGTECLLHDPTPKGTTTEIEGLPAITALKLIEVKIARGMADPRWTHHDFADVVELIAGYRFDASFERRLHKSVRATFQELVARTQN